MVDDGITVKEEKIDGVKVWRDESNNVTLSPTFAKFPLEEWLKWNESCKKDFGDKRWLKAWKDHLAVIDHAKNNSLMQDMMSLKAEIDQMKILLSAQKEEPKKAKKTVKLLGGDVEVN